MGKLTSMHVQAAKLPPNKKQIKISDGEGLCLLVNKSGRYWRYNYRYGGKQKTLAIGSYPDLTLKEARNKHHAARLQLDEGMDPGLEKKLAKATRSAVYENSFGALANEWVSKQNWTQGHERTVQSRLDRDILPYLKDRHVSDITAREVLILCQRVESRGAIESAHRIKTICSQVFRYCIACGILHSDPARDLRGALIPTKAKHMAAITDPKEVGALMRAIDDYVGTAVTRAALRLAPLVFVRPGELRHAEWDEIDFDREVWTIPPEKMKGRIKHIVPLSRQALEIIIDLKPKTSGGKYLFPSPRTSARPMSNNGILSALRRMGYSTEEMSGHGFRGMTSTLLHELGWKTELIEAQLAHKDPNGVRAAYNHAHYLPERAEMMQVWADYLDNLKEGGKVIPMRKVVRNE
ncbi:MAG: tyrosine-type recombinase/integrase [Proteobacteria bacterium]|nr:tyrosine-type recombinase/integrase [Desulfobacula sp.]MBU3951508.1 tyrosine-type recombinase/integrase [Pseudomonadota bacterium]